MMTATMEDQRPSTAPDRSLQQRLDALERANEIRRQRALLKTDLARGAASAHDLLRNPPDYMQTMKVCDLLIALPKYGRVKVHKALTQCRISPSKTIGGLSERQRLEIVGMLRR